MNLRLDDISAALGGTLEGAGDLVARGYSIDSRSLKLGDVFFAIKGPRFDGHQYVQQAFEKGAVAAVVEAPCSGGPIVRASSTTQALQALARYVRRRWAKPIIGITGSAGKTTTKEMVAAVLGKKFTVLRSVGNLNNEFGLPLCLLQVDPLQDIAVLEMGMSAKGEIRNLASIAEPNEGVVTNVNPVHLEFFKSVDEIAEAKAELIEGLHEPKVAYLNNDDHRVRAMANGFTGKVVTYGTSSASSFELHDVRDLGLDGTAFSVRHAGREFAFALPLLGRHNVVNAAAAVAVGAMHDVAWEAIRQALADMKPEKMRGQVLKFQEGFAVIDDSYNSNPRALSEMIRFLGGLNGFQRKILVAGEMLELGPEGLAMHRNCGREAAQAGLHHVIAVRGQAQQILEGALEAGMDRSRVQFAGDAAEAGSLLARMIRPGDVVLIKGSRGVKLNETIETLRTAFAMRAP